jgi:hypothetical protein
MLDTSDRSARRLDPTALAAMRCGWRGCIGRGAVGERDEGECEHANQLKRRIYLWKVKPHDQRTTDKTYGVHTHGHLSASPVITKWGT